MIKVITDYLVEIGLNLRDIVAGFLGGAVTALALGRGDKLTVVTSMFVGAAVANYCQELVVKLTGLSPGTSAFFAGIGAMAIVQGVVKAFQGWTPFKNGGGQ